MTSILRLFPEQERARAIFPLQRVSNRSFSRLMDVLHSSINPAVAVRRASFPDKNSIRNARDASERRVRLAHASLADSRLAARFSAVCQMTFIPVIAHSDSMICH